MTDLRLIPLSYAGTQTLWPVLAHYLEAALAEGVEGRSMADIAAQVAAGKMQIWAAADEDNTIVGAGATELWNFTERTVSATILWACDRPMHEWKPLLERIEDWAREQGCVSNVILGRKGWKRAIPGYTEAETLLEKKLVS